MGNYSNEEILSRQKATKEIEEKILLVKSIFEEIKDISVKNCIEFSIREEVWNHLYETSENGNFWVSSDGKC